jgi:hypothetical protein
MEAGRLRRLPGKLSPEVAVSPSTPTCPKCHITMEPGVLLDRGDHNSLSTSDWLKGEPERTFWGGLKTKGRDRLPVHTFRCPNCGYLELYAITG